MVFENAWVSNPVCMPNRSTIMTGRMPTAHGVIFNDRSLDLGCQHVRSTVPVRRLPNRLLGKSHLQHGMSTNAVVPHRGEPVATSPYPDGWDRCEHYERYLADNVEDPDDYYGVRSHRAGDRSRGEGERASLALGPRAGRFARRAACRLRRRGARQPPFDRVVADLSAAPMTLSCTRRRSSPTARWAFIEEAAADPHHPMTPPGDWFHRHRPEDMPVPATLDDPLVGAPEHLRRMQATHPSDQRMWVTPCGAGSETIVRQAIAATYGMIEMIDDRVGQVLACIERLGHTDNTIVVFTSDHGDMMGDHGLLLKGFVPYRGTLQVPMVITALGYPAGRSASLASSIDLGPTLLELCDLDGYDGIQGHELTPVLEDPTAVARDYVLVEDDFAPIAAELTAIPAKTRTLVTEDFRYTRNSKLEHQLFDLVADPDETNDVRDSRPELRAEATEQIMDALIAADDAARGRTVYLRRRTTRPDVVAQLNERDTRGFVSQALVASESQTPGRQPSQTLEYSKASLGVSLVDEHMDASAEHFGQPAGSGQTVKFGSRRRAVIDHDNTGRRRPRRIELRLGKSQPTSVVGLLIDGATKRSRVRRVDGR